MKRYSCIVPGCPWHTEAEDVAEIVRRATDHLRTSHEETEIRPSMVEHIKERIVAAEPAR
jgi:predicted small metal-binding protein